MADHPNSSQERPLQVYLDSSDFSSIADGKVAPEVVGRLESLRKERIIDLRFSVVHIAEAAPTEKLYLPSGLLRLQCIQRFCWPHAMAPHFEIIQKEATQLRTGSTIDEPIYRDDGNWFPKDLGDIALPKREKLVHDIFSERAVTREQRRKARQYFTKAGTVNAAGSKVLASNEESFVRAIADEYPTTESAKGALRKYMRGEVDGLAAMQAVIASVHEPTVLGAWLESQWEAATKITRWLRELGEKQEQSWIANSDNLLAHAAKFRQLGLDDRELWQHGDRTLKALASTAVAKIASGMIEADSVAFTPTAMQQAGSLAPSITLLAALLSQLARSAYSGSPDARSPKRSDFGDLQHCLYLPYVDFFRADRFMAEIIKKAMPALSDRVARTLPELLTLIDQRVAHTGRLPMSRPQP